MLVLSNTTDAIEVVLAGAVAANQPQCVASWRDVTTTDITLGKSVTNTNSTTSVDLVTGPASSTYRVIDFLSVYNNDTAPVTVTITYDENGTEAIITKVTLQAQERLEYVDGQGFQTYTGVGELKESAVDATEAITSGLSIDILGSDVSQASGVANTIADVTGLSFAVTSGTKYWFRFVIWYTASATSNGSRWSINGPAVTTLIYRSEYSLTTTTRTANEGLSTYDAPATSNATSSSTGSNIAIIEGLIQPSADGTLIARVANEVASNAIVAKTGSFVLYKAL